MENLNFSSKALQFLIESKRILMVKYHINVNLDDADIVSQISLLTTEHKDASLYDNLFQYWDEIEKLNPKKKAKKRIMKQRLSLAEAWAKKHRAA